MSSNAHDTARKISRTVPDTVPRTVALMGHPGDGKTTLADAMLMAASVTSRLGSVDDGTSYMNHLPEERARRITISTSIASFRHEQLELSLLDTPGDANFAGELAGAIAAADGALLVLSAQDGVKIGARRAYQQARDAGLSVVGVANKLDLERADYDALAATLEQALGTRVVKLHLPMHPGVEYDGYVDLLTAKLHVFSRDGSGTGSVRDVPAELAAAVSAAHLAMVEAAAEADDEILEKYLEEGDLSEAETRATIVKGVREGTLLPLLSAAGTRNIGAHAILYACAALLPDAAHARPRVAQKDDHEIVLLPSADGPLAAYVWKSIADRYAGTLSVLRVVSGRLHTDMIVWNTRTGAKERISKILRLSGEHTEDVREVGPGQIAALPKLKDTHTGDTLCGDHASLRILAPSLPQGMISFAVAAANKGEEDKLMTALGRIVEEDPTLRVSRDERTGELLLTGLGQLHIEVGVEKLRRLFGVDLTLAPPRVPYKETVHSRAEHIEGKLKKQSGGRGQFGVCYLTVEPGERGSGVVFLDEIVGGAIPRQFIPAVEKGVRETCEHGVLVGYEVTDIRVRCIDGKFHAVDSSEMAFKTAGSLALKAAFAQAHPVLLEPIMHVSIAVPDECVGDIMGSLNSRRGRVSGVEAQGTMEIIHADVPMAEMLSYASDLTSMTAGRGTFTMQVSRYDEVPRDLQDKLVAATAHAGLA
jgi:elongation factor G